MSGNEANFTSFGASATLEHVQGSNNAIQGQYRSSLEAVPSSVAGHESPTWVRSIRSTIQHHDTEIVNYFLNLFKIHMAPAFPTFEQFRVTESTLPDVILATGAIGGLLSKIEGSFKIALSMYTDAMRLLFSRVSSSCTNLYPAT